MPIAGEALACFSEFFRGGENCNERNSFLGHRYRNQKAAFSAIVGSATAALRFLMTFSIIPRVHLQRSLKTLAPTTMSDWIEAGQNAPAFQLTADNGAKVRLTDFQGQPVVLYFYPKDDTPGCTKEACAFRDRSREFEQLGAVVLGISPDDQVSHAAFREKYNLNFRLLADPDHQVAEHYGAWREKNLYGKKSMGVQRSTFLIDAAGKVAKAWKRVQVAGHDNQVLDALRSLPR